MPELFRTRSYIMRVYISTLDEATSVCHHLIFVESLPVPEVRSSKTLCVRCCSVNQFKCCLGYVYLFALSLCFYLSVLICRPSSFRAEQARVMCAHFCFHRWLFIRFHYVSFVSSVDLVMFHFLSFVCFLDVNSCCH